VAHWLLLLLPSIESELPALTGPSLVTLTWSLAMLAPVAAEAQHRGPAVEEAQHRGRLPTLGHSLSTEAPALQFSGKGKGLMEGSVVAAGQEADAGVGMGAGAHPAAVTQGAREANGGTGCAAQAATNAVAAAACAVSEAADSWREAQRPTDSLTAAAHSRVCALLPVLLSRTALTMHATSPYMAVMSLWSAARLLPIVPPLQPQPVLPPTSAVSTTQIALNGSSSSSSSSRSRSSSAVSTTQITSPPGSSNGGINSSSSRSVRRQSSSSRKDTKQSYSSDGSSSSMGLGQANSSNNSDSSCQGALSELMDSAAQLVGQGAGVLNAHDSIAAVRALASLGWSGAGWEWLGSVVQACRCACVCRLVCAFVCVCAFERVCMFKVYAHVPVCVCADVSMCLGSVRCRVGVVEKCDASVKMHSVRAFTCVWVHLSMLL